VSVLTAQRLRYARRREALANNGAELEVGRVVKLWNTKTPASHDDKRSFSTVTRAKTATQIP
jgi:hypothetical protein